MRFSTSVLLGLWLAGAPLAAQLPCSLEALGDRGQDPLTIDGKLELPPDCALDLGDRRLVVTGTLGGEGLTITAGELLLREGGLMTGGGGSLTILLRAGRAHPGSADVQGTIDSIGFHGGGIAIDADGSVSIGGAALIDASASDPGGSGGFLSIDARGPISVLETRGGVRVRAGQLGLLGGEVSVASTGSSVTLASGIVVSGGLESPGAVIASAAADLVFQSKLSAAGRCLGESCTLAGVVRLSAGGLLSVLAPIDVRGGSGPLFPEDGAGGRITLDAGGDIRLSADLSLAGAEASTGGAFSARCDGAFVQERGVVSGLGTGADSHGGTISISAGKAVDCRGQLIVTGGLEGLGGAIAVAADGDVGVGGELLAGGNYPADGIELVSRTGSITVRSRLDSKGIGSFGTGGRIGLYAVSGISIDGSLEASGSGEDGLGGPILLDSFQWVHLAPASRLLSDGDATGRIGEGGTIEVRGCQVTVGDAGVISASGAAGGSIYLSSAEGMVLAWPISAAERGTIEVRSGPGQFPDFDHTAFTPVPLFLQSSGLDPCLVPPPCDPVSGVVCLALRDSVSLSWQRSLGQTVIQILRDGAPVASPDAATEVYNDLSVPPGPHTYSLIGLCPQGTAQAVTCDVQVSPAEPSFIRAECNTSPGVDISDPITVLSFLFQGTPARLGCEKACDTNDDGSLDISDGVGLLGFLFLSSPPPPPPYPACGADPTRDDLSCASASACR